MASLGLRPIPTTLKICKGNAHPSACGLHLVLAKAKEWAPLGRDSSQSLLPYFKVSQMNVVLREETTVNGMDCLLNVPLPP